MKKYLALIFILLFSFSAFGQTTISTEEQFELIYNFFLTNRDLRNKSEFETTAEFQARKSDKKSIKINDKITAEEIFIFKKDLTDDIKYDADKSIYKINFSVLNTTRIPKSEFTDNEKEYSFLKLMTFEVLPPQYKKLETYKAKNGFGVEIEVEHSRITYFKITAVNTSDIPFSDSIQIPMDREKAKAAKGKIQMIIKFVLEKPYLSIDKIESKPTIDKPRHVEGWTHFLVGTINSVIISNSETGEVYKEYILKK